MYRIQKVSSYLLILFNLLLIVLPLFTLILWLFIEYSPVKISISEGLFFDAVRIPEGVVNLSTVKFVNWRAKMTPLGGKMALKIDPSKRSFLSKLLIEFYELLMKLREEWKDVNYGNNRKDTSFTLRARQGI